LPWQLFFPKKFIFCSVPSEFVIRWQNGCRFGEKIFKCATFYRPRFTAEDESTAECISKGRRRIAAVNCSAVTKSYRRHCDKRTDSALRPSPGLTWPQPLERGHEFDHPLARRLRSVGKKSRLGNFRRTGIHFAAELRNKGYKRLLAKQFPVYRPQIFLGPRSTGGKR
jgi:hypothetical protein